MMTEFRQNTEPRPGPVKRLIAFLCGAYLVVMVSYLVLRLFLSDELWWLRMINAFAFYTFTPLFVLIPLAALARQWRWLARLGLLALLFVIWYGPFFQPKSATSGGGPVLRVVTFNMQGDNPELEEVESWLDETDADVIVLQEIAPQYANGGIPSLEEVYPEQIHQDAWEQMVLSRFPIVETEEIDGQQRVVVDVDGRQIAVYNIHFMMPIRDTPRFEVNTGSRWLNLVLNYDETERNEQIRDLLAVLEEENLPYIVAGDFNMSQHSIIYSSLAVPMTDSFRATNAGLGATWPVSEQSSLIPPLLRVDYIWHSKRLRAISTQIGPLLGSDHLPVIATLELRTTPQLQQDTGDSQE